MQNHSTLLQLTGNPGVMGSSGSNTMMRAWNFKHTLMGFSTSHSTLPALNRREEGGERWVEQGGREVDRGRWREEGGRREEGGEKGRIEQKIRERDGQGWQGRGKTEEEGWGWKEERKGRGREERECEQEKGNEKKGTPGRPLTP